MRFVCRAKDRDGRRVTENIDAADRESAIHQLRGRGLMPVSLAPEQKKMRGFSFPEIPKRELALATLGLLLAASAAFFIRLGIPRTKSAPPPDSNARAVSARNSEPVLPTKKAKAAIAQPVVKTPVQHAIPGVSVKKPQRRKTSQHIDSEGVAEENPYSPKRVVIDGGPTLLLNPWALTNTPTANPMFRTEAESTLALYARPGAHMPPLPNISPADIGRALANKIEILPDDPPQTARVKEAVALMKDQLREHLEGGGTAEDFFGGLSARQDEEAGMVAEARSLVWRLLREGDLKGAAEAADECDRILAERGIPPLKVGPKYKKRLEAARAEMGGVIR